MRSSLLILVLLALSCKAPVYTLDSLPQEYLRIGSFGGFSGAEEQFILLENGQRFYAQTLNGTVGSHEMSRITHREYEQLEDALEEAMEGLKLNDSGNMNYYIELHEDDEVIRVQWTDTSVVPELFVETLRELQNQIHQGTDQ